ncbi:hypothetical protein BZA77DRAFT_297967 [Pyronema omphalodes]|nr:hypothetical protein BZA77DRAFT_297967 [Pyronema omphalodes]
MSRYTTCDSFLAWAMGFIGFAMTLWNGGKLVRRLGWVWHYAVINSQFIFPSPFRLLPIPQPNFNPSQHPPFLYLQPQASGFPPNTLIPTTILLSYIGFHKFPNISSIICTQNPKYDSQKLQWKHIATE